MSALEVMTCLHYRRLEVIFADSTCRGPGLGWMLRCLPSACRPGRTVMAIGERGGCTVVSFAPQRQLLMVMEQAELAPAVLAHTTRPSIESPTL